MIFCSRQVPRPALAATIVVALLGGMLVAGRAEAQAGWLADRSRTEGPGFRLGDFELHPGIGAEVGYDSNLYYTEDNPPAGSGRARVETGVLRITPHIMLSTIGEERRSEGENADDADSAPPTVTFRGGLSAAYYEYFADERRRNVEIDASLRLNVLPERPFSFSIWDTFGRTIRPFTENSGASSARINNNAGLDLRFQTTGGIFQVNLGYQFGLSYFEGETFQYGNYFDHSITLGETFRFLPSTAIVHDTTVVYTDYFNYNRTSSTAAVNLSDSLRLRTRIGLNGAITDAISLSGMIGYAAGFYLDAPPPAAVTYAQEYDSVVATVEGRWQISPDVRLALGYDRNFHASFIGNYYSRDRGYVAFQSLIGGAFMLGIDGDVSYLDYGLVLAPDGSFAGGTGGNNGIREDIRVTANLFMEYRFADWIGVNGTLTYSGNFTDFQYNVSGVPIDPAQFNRFQAFLGVRVFY